MPDGGKNPDSVHGKKVRENTKSYFAKNVSNKPKSKAKVETYL